MMLERERKELEQILQMLKSRDGETRSLGKTLFWNSEFINKYKGRKPSLYIMYKDFWGKTQILSFMQFRARKENVVLFLCEQILADSAKFLRIV